MYREIMSKIKPEKMEGGGGGGVFKVVLLFVIPF